MDLVDLALLIGSDGLDKQRILEAYEFTVASVGPHTWAESLQPLDAVLCEQAGTYPCRPSAFCAQCQHFFYKRL